MSFLLRNSSSQHLQDSHPPAPDLSDFEQDSQGNGSDSQISSAALEMEKLRVRFPVEGHFNVPSGEGFLLIPRKNLPDDWSDFPSSEKLRDLDRGFVFPGEKINILVSAASEHEAHEKLGAPQLLESFRNSHFHVRITGGGEENEPGLGEFIQPVSMEQDGFDPVATGGIARKAMRSCALPSGEVLVLLQVTIPAQASSSQSLMEILQFEQHQAPMSASRTIPRDLDPAQDLLHWLLPLDRNSFLPQHQLNSSASSPPAPSSATQRLSNSTFFSFGHSRSSSQGSIPQVTPAPGALAPPYPPSALNTAPGEWSRLYPEKEFGLEVDGVVSFRGVPLEPQRFSAHCGLEGLYVPGKRWSRMVSVVRPLAISSYVANCNTDDLICVLVENVLPACIADAIIYIDAISVICQEAASAGSLQQTVPIACIECGENEKLPNLPLRTGEQHSFILRPTNTSLKADASKQTCLPFRQGKEAPNAGNYAALISCHSSHTHSKFYVKHSLKWKPRPLSDLLVSVSLESSSPTMILNYSLPQLKSQVVTVQTTNLTPNELDLTLLAPSSPPVLRAPETSPAAIATQVKASVRSFQSFREAKEPAKVTSRSFSLPPGRQNNGKNHQQVPLIDERPASPPNKIEEKSSPAPVVAAESSPTRRSHLWLQSAVPLGRVPAHSTTVVKCDLVPLAEGIITLDSLHLATKDRGTLFFPENNLQIHSVSGIGD